LAELALPLPCMELINNWPIRQSKVNRDKFDIEKTLALHRSCSLTASE
jgi:hypothetical protein